MYLKSLNIKGFKSFAKSTTFEFEPGVTAIIGPNGSGKSNVLDALAWVMGEQGAKTLRGGKMEDVIFAGTQSLGPLGRASVQLTIDNSDGALPIDYTEVTISRTLFRAGGSEYAINGEQVRLLDVQELLSDSGLGKQMHVIVGQGMLDSVLRATAEDRRGFIEEAAGILKHRRRRERTANKLDGMEQNLLRLNDLATELRRQLKPLGRQATVAKKAQLIQAQVRDAKARLLADDIAQMREQLAQMRELQGEEHIVRTHIATQIRQKQERITQLEQEQMGDQLDEARKVAGALDTVVAKLRGLLTQAQQKVSFLVAEGARAGFTPQVAQRDIDDAGARLKAAEESVPAAETAWQEAALTVDRLQSDLAALDEQIAEQNTLISKYDLQIASLESVVSAADKALQRGRVEHERLTNVLHDATERETEAAQELAEFIAQYGETDDAGPVEFETEFAQAKEQVAAAILERDKALAELNTARQELAGFDAQVSALQKSLQTRDAAASLLDSGDFTAQRVADVLDVDTGFEQAIAALLGEYGAALVAESADDALTAVNIARKQDLGQVRLVYSQDAKPAEAPEIKGLRRALDVVRAPESVQWVLANGYISESAEQAVKSLQSAGDNGKYATVATLDGIILTRGTVYGGSDSAPSLIEITAERDRVQKLFDSATENIKKLEEKHAHTVAKVKTAEELQEVAYQKMRDSERDYAAQVGLRHRLHSKAESTAAELERATQAAGAGTETLAELTAQHKRAIAELEKVRDTPRPVLDIAGRDDLVQELDGAKRQEIELRLAVDTARERVRSAEGRYRAVREQFNREEEQAKAQARREVLRRRQLERASRVADELPSVLELAQKSLAEAKTQEQNAQEARAQQNQELVLVRSEAAELREKLQAVTERVHSAELGVHEKQLHLDQLRQRATDELGMPESVLLSEYGPDQPVPVFTVDNLNNPANKSVENVTQEHLDDTDSLQQESTESAKDEPEYTAYDRKEQEKRLAQATRELAELGRINPLALEEFSALEERYTFLNDQLADLKKTRSDLQQIIRDLDSKMETVFAEAFADTKKAFAEVFPVLFPGGTGDIRLTDPENMLTTGIEVTVKPVGKKVERLSLLSGGERSLAAVAWLIAIFKARPSPFYIMDEVEAALDDANLGRLLTAFEDLRKNSQLILITHQKRTMEIADALYGVSMRGDGVSAVVGQRIQEQQ